VLRGVKMPRYDTDKHCRVLLRIMGGNPKKAARLAARLWDAHIRRAAYNYLAAERFKGTLKRLRALQDEARR